jgi:hypothetical protein
VEQTQSSAPVSAHAEIDVAAEDRIVWAVIADIASWPTWNPSARQVTVPTEFERGSVFRYSSPLGSMTCRLTQVNAPRELAWHGRLLTMDLGQVWRIEPAAAGSRVSLDASLSGLIARVLRHRWQVRLQDDLDALARLMKLEAEVRSVEERDGAARAADAEAEEEAGG